MDEITIICPSHGEFRQVAISHWTGKGCHKCSMIISSGHQQVIDFIRSIYDGEMLINDRKMIDPLELDIYLPKERLAIEYNGMFYHSFNHNESVKERSRHKTKHLAALDKNISLIQVGEHKWLNKPEIIKSMIANKLGKSQKIYARKCKVIKIDNKVHKQFVNSNHIYGQGRHPSISYGLIYQGDLVSIMSFNKHPKHEWEINRLVSKLNYLVTGGAGKLFKHFIKTHNPQRVLTYADARFGCGNVYNQLDFVNVKITGPGYCYIKNSIHFNRQQFQKHKLKDRLEIFNPDLTEADNMFNNGYRRLWDAGNYKFLWSKP